MADQKKNFAELLSELINEGVQNTKTVLKSAITDAKDVIDLKLAEKKRKQIVESILDAIVYHYRESLSEIDGVKDLYMLLDVYDKQIKILNKPTGT